MPREKNPIQTLASHRNRAYNAILRLTVSDATLKLPNYYNVESSLFKRALFHANVVADDEKFALEVSKKSALLKRKREIYRMMNSEAYQCDGFARSGIQALANITKELKKLK